MQKRGNGAPAFFMSRLCYDRSVQSKILSALLLLSILSVAIFGFLGMGVFGHELAHTCPFSSLVSGDCAILDSVASLAAHHFAALQNLAQTMASFDILFLVFSLLFLFALFSLRPRLLKLLISDACRISRNEEDLSLVQKLRLLRWLAS